MRHRLLCLALLPLMLLCTGCWDVAEINARSIVMAMAFDRGTAGKIRVYAQIPVVARLLPPTAGGSGPSDKPFHVVISEAESVIDSVDGLQSKTAKNLFVGQLKAVIIGSGLAKQGLASVVDSLNRHPEIPPQAVMVLTDQDVEEVVSSPLNSGELPATELRRFLTSRAKADQVYPMKIWQFVRTVEVGPEDAYLPLVSYNKKEEAFAVRGLGVFRRDRLVGELSGNEARMFGLLLGKTRNAYPTVPIGRMGRVSFRMARSSSGITVKTSGNGIGMDVKVQVEAFLAEVTSAKSRFSPEDIKSIERKMERTFEHDMAGTIRHLQALESDALGFGEIVRSTRPDLWREIKDWPEVYRDLPVRIAVEFRVERTGTYR